MALTTTQINQLYGYDIGYDVEDNDLTLVDKIVGGRENIAQRITRMLRTPYGALSNIDPDPAALVWGWDCGQYLNMKLSQENLYTAQVSIQNAILQDEEIENCNVSFDFDSKTSELDIQIDCDTAEGPFQLVLTINNVNSTIVFNSGFSGSGA